MSKIHDKFIATAAEIMFSAQGSVERLAEMAEGLGLEATARALDKLWTPISEIRLKWAGDNDITPTGD